MIAEGRPEFPFQPVNLGGNGSLQRGDFRVKGATQILDLGDHLAFHDRATHLGLQLVKRDVNEAFCHLLGLIAVHPKLLCRARDLFKSLMVVIWVFFDPLNLVAFVE